MSKNLSARPEGYGEFLEELKSRIHQARMRAALAINRELVALYWGIGREILAQQERRGWGAKVVEQLAEDLHRDFPNMTGLSRRNLLFMRGLAEAWPEEAIVKQVVSQIPWGHNIRLLQKVKDRERRIWYARKAFEHGWSRDVLVHHIDTELFEREGSAPTNFKRTLPAPDSDLAQQTLKDPYTFEFLTLADDAREKELERGLLENLQQFMLELGRGFAFLGSQYPIEVGGEAFRIDLLFYHVHLRRYVVIELKTTKFRPEYAGKLGFYLTAVDKQLRHADDEKTIGLLLCTEKNRLVVEYALEDSSKPMGVAEYRVLPKELQGELPSVQELEARVVRSSVGEDVVADDSASTEVIRSGSTEEE